MANEALDNKGFYVGGGFMKGKQAWVPVNPRPLPLRPNPLISSPKQLRLRVGPSLFANKDNSNQNQLSPNALRAMEGMKKRIAERQNRIRTDTKSADQTTTQSDRSTSSSKPITSTTSTSTTSANTNTMTTKEEKRKETTSSGNRGGRNTSSRGGRGGRSGDRRGDDSFHTSSTHIETKTPFNTYSKATDSSPYVVDAIDGPVSWNLNIDSSCILRPEVLSQSLSGGEIQPKLHINCSSFALAISDATLNNVKYYDTFLSLLFNRFQTDVLRLTKGAVPSYWTSSNFRTAMVSVVQALEYYYTLDSILSFKNRGVSEFRGSRTLEVFSVPFNQSAILQQRDNLRKQLQGVWCPPSLSMFIRSFFQYYRSSDAAGQASIFRYVPHPDFVLSLSSPSTVSTNVTTTLNSLVTNLAASNTPSILGLLSNLHPEGIINGMPMSSDDAYYSNDMLELFVNDVTVFNDVNNTNAISVCPISYFDTSNDIPYYSMLNPKQANGANFGLQSLPTTATTVNTGVAWATQTNYFGLRKPVLCGSSPNVTNKYMYDATTQSTVPRNQANPSTLMTGLDTHLPLNIASVTTMVNTPTLGLQRVYFDQYNAPATIFNIVASKLFDTAV